LKAKGADHFRVAAMADEDDVAILRHMTFGFAVNLRNQRAGRVEIVEPARFGIGGNRFGHAMRRKDDRRTVRNLVKLIDEDRAFGFQAVYDETVMHDLVADIDRLAIFLDGELDDGDCAIDTGAETARGGDQKLKRGMRHARGTTRLLAPAKPASYEASIRFPVERRTPVKILIPLVALSLLAGCARNGEIDETGGILTTRSTCPAVAVAANTGDVTLFDPPASRDARAIDVVATVTNVRSSCTDAGTDVNANATFDILARRTNAGGARDVVLPYFVVIVRGGTNVVAKRIGRATVRFEAGQTRARTTATGGALIDRAMATLPKEVTDQLRRKRKADDADASIDPLARPEIRTAVAKATFEVLVGFQLTGEQLQYNATR
jgi:hypothetical protein